MAPGENPGSQNERAKGRRARLLADAPKPLLSKESIRWVTEAFSYSSEHVTDDWLDIRHQVAMLPKTVEAVGKVSKLLSTVLLPHLARQKEETLGWIKGGRLKTPTLLIWGYNDPSAVIAGGIELFSLVASSVPRSQFHILNKSGHYSYREHPEDFVRVVANFIQGGRD